MCLLGYVDQVFAKDIIIIFVVWFIQHSSLLCLHYLLLNKHNASIAITLFILTKCVLLPEIHSYNTIFCHNNKTALAVIYVIRLFLVHG